MTDRSRDSHARLARSIRRGRSHVLPIERLAGALLGLFLVLAPLSGGGILAGFAVPIALAATGVWGVALWAASQREEGYRIVPLALAAAALAALALLRGSSWGSWLAAPWTVSSWTLWPSLPETGALAPGGSAAAAVRLVGLALVADASAMRFGTTNGFKSLLLAAVGAGTLAMLVGVVHEAVGAKALYGSYTFPAASHFIPLAAPYSNPNVAGSLACLAGICAWGLASLRSDRPAARTAWAAAGVVLVCHAVRLEAFGALTATGAALAAGGLSLVFVRRVPLRRQTVLFVLLPFVGAAVSLGLVRMLAPEIPADAGVGGVGGKMLFWQRLYSHLREASWWGFGPGGFHDLGARILPLPGGYRPAFAESEPAQLIFDHGWLAAIAVAAVGVWVVGSTIFRLCAATRPGYAAAVSVLATWVLVDAQFGMAWESLPFAGLLLALAAAFWRMARPLDEQEGLRFRGRLMGGLAVVLLLAATPGLSASTSLGQSRGRNPFAGMDRPSGSAEGAWKESVLSQARLSPAAPIVLAEEGRRALAAKDAARAAQISEWLREAAPMDESAMAFRINEAESRRALAEVCELSRVYLTANNPHLVRPRFWLRMGKEVSKWVACLPPSSSAEEAAVAFLRRSKRNEEALALTLGLMARSPRNLPTLDAGFSISLTLRRYDSAEIFLQQRASVAPADPATAEFGIRLDLARGRYEGLLARIGAEIVRFPSESALRMLRVGAVAALAQAGREPADAIGLLEEDGRELRIATGGSPEQIARVAFEVGRALMALGRLDDALVQFRLAREDSNFRATAERHIAAVEKARQRAPRGLVAPASDGPKAPVDL